MKRLSISAVLVLFMCSSCPSMSAGQKVVFLGDSITQGNRSLELFANDGFEVVNSGVGGDHTDKALSRLPDVLLEHKPKIVVIMFGTNDSNPTSQTTVFVTAEKYKQNLLQMISMCNKAGARVILCTPIPGKLDWRNKGMKPYVENVREICAKKPRVQLVDTYQIFCELLQETVKHDDIF